MKKPLTDPTTILNIAPNIDGETNIDGIIQIHVDSLAQSLSPKQAMELKFIADNCIDAMQARKAIVNLADYVLSRNGR